VSVIASHTVWSARRQVYEARKLGRYRLVAPIGKGGMNEVWLAHDERLRRHVALKLLSRMEGVSAAEAERFEREALAASRLTSPHTIRVLDFGASDDGIYYIAMEYLPGADLGRLVREHGPMPPARVLHFARQACRALHEAHQAGVIHRDIKPHNLFVTQVDGQADHLKLLDFGLARMQELGMAAQRTATGVIRGTPAYLPPEAWAGGTVDARSDLYSLGATLYHLLAGVPPFHNVALGNLVAAHLLEAPPAPSLLRGQPLPPALEHLVLKCLAKNPAERFASAEALLEALESCDPEVARWTQQEAPPKTGAQEASVAHEAVARLEPK
jgi:serine/threonine protein kinase